MRIAPRKIAQLSAMYFAQGLPFGFQAFALPLYLRRGGASLTAIAFLGALSAPWLAKPLWAPFVDRWGAERFGRRKSWIVPLQGALAATCVAASLGPSLPVLLGLVFVMNLLTAIQDIAVDGLAVDLLSAGELGAGNAAQVCGYKLGMVVGGGVLGAVSGSIGGWHGLFLIMAGLILAVTLVTLTVDEPPAPRAASGERIGFRDVFRALAVASRQRGTITLLIFLVTYKTGEVMLETMWKPFLVDAGFSDAVITTATGTVGMAASIAGSLAGGWLATTMSPMNALWLPAAGRILPMAAQWLIAATAPTTASIFAVAALEHLFGGALTTVVFATMMARVDKRIGASHYTLLAAVEVLGKYPGGWLSGPLASRDGYPAVFATGTLLSVAFLGVLALLARAERLNKA